MSDKKTSDTPDEGESDFDSFEEELEEHLFDESEFDTEGWSIPRDPESVARVLKSLEGLMPDVLRRRASHPGAGDDGPLGDEESAAERLRSRLSDHKLPREAVSFLLGQLDTTKREFLRILSREIRLFLEDVDLGGELAKILTSLSFEVRMEVRFIPNDQALHPSAKGSMRVKRTSKKSDKSDASGGDAASQSDDGRPSSSRSPKSKKRPREHPSGSGDADDRDPQDG